MFMPGKNLKSYTQYDIEALYTANTGMLALTIFAYLSSTRPAKYQLRNPYSTITKRWYIQEKSTLAVYRTSTTSSSSKVIPSSKHKGLYRLFPCHHHRYADRQPAISIRE
jgi:hypothetical protein